MLCIIVFTRKSVKDGKLANFIHSTKNLPFLNDFLLTLTFGKDKCTFLTYKQPSEQGTLIYDNQRSTRRDNR